MLERWRLAPETQRSWVLSKHALERSAQRKFVLDNVEEVLLCGEVISRRFVIWPQVNGALVECVSLVIGAWVWDEEKQCERRCNVAVAYAIGSLDWTIVTLYEPNKEQWNDQFTRRICFTESAETLTEEALLQ